MLKASAAAAATIFASPLRAQAPAAAPITPALIEAAKKEGKLSFYTAMDLPLAERFGKVFEAKYPGIAVRVERSGAERVFQRIGQEYESRIHAVDVVNTRRRRALASSGSATAGSRPICPRRSPSITRQDYYDPDGLYVTTRVLVSADRLQHQPGEERRTRRRASPTCSIRNGPARW